MIMIAVKLKKLQNHWQTLKWQFQNVSKLQNTSLGKDKFCVVHELKPSNFKRQFFMSKILHAHHLTINFCIKSFLMINYKSIMITLITKNRIVKTDQLAQPTLKLNINDAKLMLCIFSDQKASVYCELLKKEQKMNVGDNLFV